MLDSHEVSKARDLNLTASTEEDKAPISSEETSPLSAKDMQCLLFR